VAFTLSLLTARFVFKNWFSDEQRIISASPQSAVSDPLVGTFYSLRLSQQVAPIRLNDCALMRGDKAGKLRSSQQTPATPWSVMKMCRYEGVKKSIEAVGGKLISMYGIAAEPRRFVIFDVPGALQTFCWRGWACNPSLR
jgi:hypothetical protein